MNLYPALHWAKPNGLLSEWTPHHATLFVIIMEETGTYLYPLP